MWNGTVDVTKSGGDPLLDRHVDVTLGDLPGSRYRLRHRRLDEQHSNLNRTWARIASGRAWPDDAGWNTLRAENRLVDLAPPAHVHPSNGVLDLAFDLPMPGVSLIELEPIRS